MAGKIKAVSIDQSTMEITRAHIEALQDSLLSERQDRAQMLGRIGELETSINLLTKQFKHASIERDVEKAKTTLFTEVSDIRSPSLVLRTIATLLDYPGAKIVCILKTDAQWSVITEVSDEHIYVTSSQMDELLYAIEMQQVVLERVTSLPNAIVNAISLAYGKRYDSYNVKDNMIFTALGRDCAWSIVSEESLRPLVDTLHGWAALLSTATRLVVESYRRQQDDIERNESELIRAVFDRVFAVLFTETKSVSIEAVKQSLLDIISILNNALPACSSEIFILDANNVCITSSFEYLNLGNYSESSVLLTCILQQRSALCIDPANTHRDLYLDCGNVLAPIAAIIAIPLWISSDISGYVLFRLFDTNHQDRYVKLAESLATTLGPMIQFWSRQNMSAILKSNSSTTDIVPSLSYDALHTLTARGCDSFIEASVRSAIASALQCSWVVFISAIRSETTSKAWELSLYNDHGDKSALPLRDARDEFKGFLYSILGIEDEELIVAFEASRLSHRKGLIHLLNGISVSASGLQLFLRETLKPLANLIGFRVAHPDADIQDTSNAFVAVIGGRGWGVFESDEVSSRVSVLISTFGFVAEHRSITKLLDLSRTVDKQILSMEADAGAKQIHRDIVQDFIDLANTMSDDQPSNKINSTNQLLAKLERIVGAAVELILFESAHRCFWAMGPASWVKREVEYLTVSDVNGRSTGSVFEANGAVVSVIHADANQSCSSTLLLCAMRFDAKGYESVIVDLLHSISVPLMQLEHSLLHSFTTTQDSVIESGASDVSSLLVHEIRDGVAVIYGGALLKPVVNAFLPVCCTLPIYLSSHAVVSLNDMQALPSALGQTIRSVYLTSSASDGTNVTVRRGFTLLSNPSMFADYSDSRFTADRAYLYWSSSFQGLMSEGDCVVVVVLCSSEYPVVPGYFEYWEKELEKTLLPVMIMNKIGALVVAKKEYESVYGSLQSSNELVIALQEILSKDESSYSLTPDEVRGRATFQIELLQILTDMLVDLGYCDLMTSAIEKTACNRLGGSGAVSIIWPEGSKCLTRSVYNEDMLKLVRQSGKSLLLEVDSSFTESNEELGTVNYIPIYGTDSSTTDIMQAVIQVRSAPTGSSKLEELVLQCVSSSIRSVAAHDSSPLHHGPTIESFCEMADGVQPDNNFMHAIAAPLSTIVATHMRANVCILQHELESGASRSGGLVGTVYRWHDLGVNADASTTRVDEEKIQSGVHDSLLTKGGFRGKTYTVFKRFATGIIVVESLSRIPTQAVVIFESLMALASALYEQHTLKAAHSIQSYLLHLEQLHTAVHDSNETTDLYTIFETSLKAAFQCKEGSLIQISKTRVSEITEGLKNKEIPLYVDMSDEVRWPEDRLVGMALSTNSVIPCRMGHASMDSPCIYIPVIVLEDCGFALKLVFDTMGKLNEFMEVGRETRLPTAALPSIRDAVRLADAVSKWFLRGIAEKLNEVNSTHSAALLSLNASFSKLLERSLVPPKPSDAQLTNSYSPSKLAHASASTKAYERLAMEIITLNEGLTDADVVTEYRLHWRAREVDFSMTSEVDRADWVTHSAVQSFRAFQGTTTPGFEREDVEDRVVVKASTAGDVLYRLQKKEIEIERLGEGCVLYMLVALTAALEIRLRKPLAEATSIDTIDASVRGAIRSIQHSAQQLLSSTERTIELDESFRTSQRVLEADASLLSVLSDCIFDVYDRSSSELNVNRVEACIKAVHFHLGRFPNIEHVSVEYTSPDGVCCNIGTDSALLFQSPQQASQRFASTGTLRLSYPPKEPTQVAKEFAFECHECHGNFKVLVRDSISESEEQLLDVGVKTVAKVVGRRVYELDKAYRNKKTSKAKSEQLSKKKREVVEVDAQRASLQSSLEESKHDIEVLKQTLSTLQKTNEDEKRSHEIFASDSLLLIDGAQKALEEKQRLYESETLIAQEKIQSLSSERSALEHEKMESAVLLKSLQDRLTANEHESREREQEWKAINKDAHAASLQLRELQLTTQFQSVSNVQLTEENQSMLAEKERLVASLTAAEKQVTDLASDKEKAIQKLIKRDAKIKDAAVLIENLQKSHDTLKEQTTEVITRLQIENKELNMKLSLTQREGVQVESQTVAASRASVDTMQKSLIHAETELTELRKKYQEAVSVTVPKLESELGDALRRINELTKTNAQLTGTLAEKQDEVGMWKKKFAVTEKERETLIEGWKDIVSTAGGSTNAKPKKPSGKSVWKM